jgi:hypothetical protein
MTASLTLAIGRTPCSELALFVRAVSDAAGGAGLSSAETCTLALDVYEALVPLALIRDDPYHDPAEAKAAEATARAGLAVCVAGGG